MQTFKDSTGKSWTLDLNVGSIRRVKAETKIDLLEVLDGKLLEELGGNPLKVFDIVWSICKPSGADEAAQDAFASAMRGDTLKAAADALAEELVVFFQNRGPALRAALDRVNRATQTVVQAVVDRINGPEIDQLLAKELGSLSGNSPASSASTPPDSPSDSST